MNAPAKQAEEKLRSEAEDHISRYRADPVAFVRECFGVEPDPWQLEALSAFPNNRRMALQAAKGPGKTALLAWLIWNFMLNEHANIAACSISAWSRWRSACDPILFQRSA